MKKCKYYTNINIYTIQILTKTKLAYLYCFKIFYLFIFREGGGREKDRERNIDVWLPLALGTRPTMQACALTENQTIDPLVRRPALNPLS